MKHFLCRHIFIYVCVMFLCAICIFCVVSYSEGLAEVNYGAFVDSCGGYLYFSHGKSLKKFCYCPVGHKLSPPVCAPANQHFCLSAGTNGHVRRPRAQNCAIFFARRNALAFSVLRPFQEKFPKISPKFLRQKFGVCAKSPYLCIRKSEMRPTTPRKSEAIRSLKTLHKTIL